MIDRRDFLTGSAAVATVAALPTVAAPATAARATALLDAIADELLTDYPENALYLGIDTGKRAALHGKINDRSAAADTRRRAAAGRRLAQLKAFDRAGLAPATALHLDVAQASYQLAVDGWAAMPVGDVAVLNSNVSYRSTPYVVAQNTGAFVEVPDLLETKHAIATREDVETYLERLEAYGSALDDETRRITADAAAGVVLPAFLNDVVVRQQRAAAAVPVTDWSIARTMVEKAAAAHIPGDWSARAAHLVAERIAPALNRQADALAALRPRASDTPGMWRQPDAEARYAWLVAAGTTTTRTPEEIHAGGLEQCRALAAQLDPLLRAQGLTQGTAGQRLAALGKRPDQLFADTDAGRAQLLAYLAGVVADIRPRLPRAFGKLVKGNLQIRRVPVAIEAGAPNGYAGPGSLDGTRPGIYYINLKDTGIWPRFALPTLTFHEGIPGHIWQGEYTFDLPLVRTLLAFNAYSEGWGLYAEQLGDELGVYDRNPLGRIGYLQSMNFRAARLVADTGLHHKRWSFEQALRFFMETTGLTASQSRSELNRYCAWPGQALGYKTGHNEINRLRDAARARLGARYDVRRFDDLVVQTGNVPLGVLAKVVDGWTGA